MHSGNAHRQLPSATDLGRQTRCLPWWQPQPVAQLLHQLLTADSGGGRGAICRPCQQRAEQRRGIAPVLALRASAGALVQPGAASVQSQLLQPGAGLLEVGCRRPCKGVGRQLLQGHRGHRAGCGEASTLPLQRIAAECFRCCRWLGLDRIGKLAQNDQASAPGGGRLAPPCDRIPLRVPAHYGA
jgi:hypothetical protein